MQTKHLFAGNLIDIKYKYKDHIKLITKICYVHDKKVKQTF